jgi:tetratricopeptide (TPR) repeat protein
MRCESCDLESDWEQAFRRVRKSFTLQKPKTICPACWQRRQAVQMRGAVAFILLMAFFVAATLVFADAKGRALFLAAYCTIPFIPVATVLHEAAHALASLVLGLRLFAVCYGVTGRVIYRRYFFDCAFEVRSSLSGGMAVPAPRSLRWLRLRWWLLVAAAPVTNGLLAACAIPFLALSLHSPIGETLAIGFGGANLIVAGVSLIPWKIATARGVMPSDGLALLTIPFESQARLQEKRASYFAMEGAQCLRRRDYASAEEWAQRGLNEYPGNLSIRSVLGVALLGQRRFDEAKSLFLELAASDKPPGNAPPYKALFLNNAAWTDLMAGGAERLVDADRYSQQAMRLTPWVAEIKGTRGSVLVTLGQTDEGLRLLEEAIEDHDANANKALNACFLALGFHKAGNSAACRRLIEKARQLDPQCELIPWAVEQSSSPAHSETDPRVPAVTPELSQ